MMQARQPLRNLPFRCFTCTAFRRKLFGLINGLLRIADGTRPLGVRQPDSPFPVIAPLDKIFTVPRMF
jgi:hypothetical protein